MNRHTHTRGHDIRRPTFASGPGSHEHDEGGYRTTRRVYAEHERLGPEDFGAQGFGGMHSWGSTQSSGGSYTGSGWQGGSQPWHGGYDEDEAEETSAGNGGLPTQRSHWAERPGSHAGKGPKGYLRSDERIREDVCELLLRNDYVDPSEVEVGVETGVVTLTGTIGDRSQKRILEDLAESVSGVIDVDNRVRVVRHESYRTT